MKSIIPEDLTSVYGPPLKVMFTPDDLPTGVASIHVPIDVYPAFITEKGSKTIETARKWVKNKYGYNFTGTKNFYEYTCKNDPQEIRVVGLEHRGNGGRAYKVLGQLSPNHTNFPTPLPFYYDLREDVLLETLLTKGCKPGGLLDGEFVWTKPVIEMKLVRVGSVLHAELDTRNKAISNKPIHPKNLIVGNKYSTGARNAMPYVYLGKFVTHHIETETGVYDKSSYTGTKWTKTSYAGYGRTLVTKVKNLGSSVVHLFHVLYNWNKTLSVDNGSYELSMVKNPTFKIDLGPFVPFDPNYTVKKIQSIRTAWGSKFQKELGYNFEYINIELPGDPKAPMYPIADGEY